MTTKQTGLQLAITVAGGLPKMAKAASNEHLRRAFEEHLKETQSQVGRLDDDAEIEQPFV